MFLTDWGVPDKGRLDGCCLWHVGLLEQSRLKEFLYGPLFEVEVHDRDQLIQKFGETGSLFGEEPNDEMLGSPNTGSHEHFACFVCRYLTSF